MYTTHKHMCVYIHTHVNTQITHMIYVLAYLTPSLILVVYVENYIEWVWSPP